MTSPAITHLSLRDNPLLKALRRLSQDSSAYRKLGKLWLEGDHLCRASLERGFKPVQAVFAESMLSRALAQWPLGDARVLSVPDALFGEISGLESPAGMGFVLDLPAPPVIQAGVPAVVLDRLQDAGNVGSILRSAGAFGFRQVVALQGTAALWSQKVLRAGMGAHFGLSLVEGAGPDALELLGLPLLVTSSHQGEFLQTARLPWPCAWVMGHEGQGVGAALMARASLSVRIGQPGGEESLNVAAAAAICLHASAVSRSA